MHASSREIGNVDVPFMVRKTTVGGAVTFRGGHPCKSLVVEVAREVDDDVCVGDTVGIG